MIMVIDVGNTHIVLGVFAGDELVASWRIGTDRRRTSDDLGMLVKNLFSFRGLDAQDILYAPNLRRADL